MLKLNSSNGKFDIVFAGDLLLGGKKKLDFRQADSIQRCKNTDLKSQILPKEEQIRKVKPKKYNPVKNNEEDERRKKVVSPNRKVARETVEQKIANKNKGDEKLKKPPDKRAARKTISKEKNSDGKSLNQKEIDNKDKILQSKKKREKTENPTTPLSNRENSNVEENMFKRTSFQNGGVVTNPNVGVISREDLNNMFSGFFEDSKTKKSVEPVSIPGLNLDGKIQDSTFPNLHLNNKEEFPRNPRRYVEEDYDPWGRPGCGAPSKVKSPDVVTDYNSSTSPSAPTLTNRDHHIRNLQSSQNEEYNPWGKPGCGAPLKDKNQNVVADLKSYKSSGTNNSSRAQSYPGQPAPKQLERDDKLQTSFDVKKSSPEQLDLNVSPGSTFARGQGKTQHELQDIQKRRLKELEHQAAIKQQVEEKRRIKRLEKERELKEEQEAEERFRKETEKLREMAENEKQKQREQEEKQRKKQEMLEESIKKANLENKKVKESMRHGSPRKQNSVNSKSNRAEEKANYVRRLHHDEDVIVPAATTGFSAHDEKKLPVTHNNELNNEKKDGGSRDFNVDAANKTFTQSPSDGTNLKNKHFDEMITGTNNKSNRMLNDNKPLRQQQTNFNSNSKTMDSNVEKERDTQGNNSGRKFEFKVNNEVEKDTETEPMFNDYMIPFHRTQTAELLDNHPKPLLTSETKKSSKSHSPKRLLETESHSLPDMTSSRQQQIISQLHALRQGLMQKEREYVLEKYS